MSRCDCEGVFYRVFCVSLLVIAFTFTVILTNVFVDIDNLLSKRERESTENIGVTEHVTNNNHEDTTEIQDYYIGAETHDEGNYRNKRSLEPTNFFFRINSPKTKSYLTNKLATLLEALDDEESENTTPKAETGNIYIKTVKQKNNIEINELRPENKKRAEVQPDEDIMYLTLLKILQDLQGIGRADKHHEFIDNLQTVITSSKHGGRRKERKNTELISELYPEITPKERIIPNEEQNFMEEKLGEEKVRSNSFELNDAADAENDKVERFNERSHKKTKNPKYIIKTFIDIQNDENANSKEDFQGVVKLMYNGKRIKTKGEDSSEAATSATTTIKTTTMKQKTTTTENTVNNDVEAFADVLKDKFKDRQIPDNYLRTITLEYLKKFEKTNGSLIKIKKKKIRIKRNLESSDEKQLETPHTKDDDELFVEIETHFDKNGMDGEKKRQLVSNLIEKIQNAIRSSSEKSQLNRNQREPYVMRRIQNPLNRGTSQNQTETTSVSSLYRNLDPISKSMSIVDPLPLVASQNAENWGKKYPEPKFLSSSKSINSAELNQLAVDYKQNDKYPVIPKRVQLPLSIDTSHEKTNTEDVGKLQLLIKDIEGTGFSIGYNQYVDQAPDAESMKLFHGIEDIVKKYHQKHDNPDQLGDHEGEYEMYGQEMKKREVKNDVGLLRTKRFLMNRKNIRESEKLKAYSDNENKYIYRNNYRSCDLYKKIHDTPIRSIELEGNNLHDMIFERKGMSSFTDGHRKKRSITIKTIMNANKKMRVNKYLNTKAFPLQTRYFKINKRNKRQIRGIKSLEKTGLASENNNMFTVSNSDVYSDNLLVTRRQKPDLFYIEVIKSNKEDPFLKNKPFFRPSNHPFGLHTPEIRNLNTYNPMLYKSTSNHLIKIQENKERNKRQLHTVRIIDRDMGYKNLNQGFGENGEDIYADRAVITGIDGSQIRPHEGTNQYSHNRMSNIPTLYRNPLIFESVSFEHKNPIITKNRKTNSKHEFSLIPTWEQIIGNPLMAKYPHVFEEGVTRLEGPQVRKHLQRNMFSRAESKESDTSVDDEEMYPSSNVQDLIKAVVPTHRNNYKVSIRLIPHDGDNDTKPGFKEIHTSINKTFNKNGLQYSSIVNVSEISKVEVSHNTNISKSRKSSYNFKSTTPNNVKTNTMKPLQKKIGFENTVLSYSQRNNNETHKILNITESKPSEVATEAAMDINLIDIVLPTSPRKVFHLTITDLGKLICDAMKSQDSDKLSTTQTEKYTPKAVTTSSTTTTSVPTVATSTTTIKPITHSTYATITVDPLKMKLLKSISQNEQLTSQILNRIDQNTDILQSFLSKITSEIAKLPDIANQAIIERDKKKSRNPIIDPNLSNVYTTPKPNIIPVTNAYPQGPAAIRRKNYIQTSPILKNILINDRMEDLPVIQRHDDIETRQKKQAKYFMDTVFLNKTSVPHDLPGLKPHNLITPDGLADDKTSKPNTGNISNINLDPSQALNNIHSINNVDSNVNVQNNTIN